MVGQRSDFPGFCNIISGIVLSLEWIRTETLKTPRTMKTRRIWNVCLLVAALLLSSCAVHRVPGPPHRPPHEAPPPPGHGPQRPNPPKPPKNKKQKPPKPPKDHPQPPRGPEGPEAPNRGPEAPLERPSR